jgi:hypothetical protein
VNAWTLREMGLTQGRGRGGGRAGPPSEGLDKQLNKSDMASITHNAQST